MGRVFINVSDVVKLTGQSKRTAYRIIQTIKDAYCCRKVTFESFCKFYDLDEAKTRESLRKS